MNATDQASVAAGAFALTELHRSWENWQTVMIGLVALRKEAMASSKRPAGEPLYNQHFAALIEELGYSELALEKNTRAALINIGLDKEAQKRLKGLMKEMEPDEARYLTPRKAWKLCRPDAEKKDKGSGAEDKPEKEEKYTNNSKLEAMLGDAKDRLHHSVVLHIDVEDEEIEAQVATLSSDPETEPRLRFLYGVLRRLYATKGGLGIGNVEDAEIVE